MYEWCNLFLVMLYFYVTDSIYEMINNHMKDNNGKFWEIEKTSYD